jgi:hypothetical protein
LFTHLAICSRALVKSARSHSELLRERLEAIFQEWRTPFADCIAGAQAAGEVDSKFDPVDLAEFLLASWEGAILRMKVERSSAALERCQFDHKKESHRLYKISYC